MSETRRKFIKTLPAAAGAALLAPKFAEGAAAQAGQQAGTQSGITAEMLGVAQQVAGVSLPEAERESARTLVTRNLANIEAIRRIPLTATVEPAFSYRPPVPAAPAQSAASGRGRAQTPPAVSRPANLAELAFAPVSVLSELVRTRKVSSVELTSMYLDRLKKHDATLNCVVTLTEELARAQAAEADRQIRSGAYRGPLHGIPYGIKDLFAARGIPTTWGAKPYENQTFDYDSTPVVRMREAGAVLLAKLSTGELAVGDLWFRGRTRNPWNPERGSSGSSAGPASATSAGLVACAIGTETNGSIVSPASTCGVVGLRPTYGRISRYGCMTLRWTLDKVGALARSVDDTGTILRVLHGPDGHDETVPSLPFAWDGGADVKGLRIGLLEREFAGNNASAAVLNAALDVYRKAGAALIPVTLPESPAAAIYALLNAEAGAMFDELVRTGGINQMADTGVNGRANQLRAARFIPAVDYVRAQRARTVLLGQMNELFTKVDVVLSPTSSEILTMANLTGHPGMTVPAGFVDRLPVGLMMTGALFKEDVVLRAGAFFERATEWHRRAPERYA
jgi:Asp-tRNA(Asn)/Glu-tRNA(Gln) amidotransferase A subunit family amidase